MQIPRSFFRASCVTIAAGGFLLFQGQAQDMVAVAPSLCKVRLDNEWVRVVEVRGNSGDKMPMHSHPGSLTYFFHSGKARFTDSNGQPTERETKANTAKWSDPEKHAVDFLSPDAFTLVVEVKKPTGKKTPPGADPTKVAADAYKVVLENEHIRVLEMQAKEGTKIPMHSHPAYVAYDVTTVKAKFTDASGKSEESNGAAGDVVWREPEAHAVTIESAGARVLVVELKR
jgi:beta-alanine degradation protein BauB